MTLIIETGTGKADSQSYVSKAEINSYFDSEVNSVDLSKLMPRARLYIDNRAIK